MPKAISTVTEMSKMVDTFNNLTEKDQMFVFHYRAKYRPTFDFVKGMDLQTVRNLCLEYCTRFELHFISVRPFFLDLTKRPRDSSGFQSGPLSPKEN